ncbi:hypothetical protein VP01_785g1 [Puccinia sorghi]|uniref:Alkyl hydroperoxide reductase subunit C/ Thiol specific antioxidant domain-containing protein n=1 Tax=Puccinia sorghi TaxID=27349 RepID=A0A0L6UAX8_9BASI|nr:hypothetical protein VP01_785g1 [Puccinia sorghi]
MPKKRGPTESESEVAAPRRSTRVSSKPPSAALKEKPAPVRKPAKTNGSTKKAKGTTKLAVEAATKRDDDTDDSLSELSAESQLKKLEETGSKPPPKKKSKAEERSSTTENEAAGSISPKNKLPIGEKLPESIILKNHDNEDVNVLHLTQEKGSVPCPHSQPPHPDSLPSLESPTCLKRVQFNHLYLPQGNSHLIPSEILIPRLSLTLLPIRKSNTPGCTTQACGYRDLHQEILDAGFQVVGLSMDSPKSQTTWKVKQKLPYPLLCDPEVRQRLIKLLGSSKTQSSVQRSHFIFEAGGKLLHVDPKATTTTSPKQALEFIQSLSNGETEEKKTS